jgi:cytochrome P450
MSSKGRNAIEMSKSFADRLIRESMERYASGKMSSNPNEYYSMIDDLVAQQLEPSVIRDQVWSTFVAARDTTSSLLSFTTYFLAKNPRVWQKLREAVFETLGSTPEGITFESLKRCSYVGYVLNETMRVCSIVPINLRVAIRDTVLPRGGGPNEDQPIYVPKGASVIFASYYAHRDKPVWGEDATEFWPERWEDPATARHGWNYIPFNGGPRICLGQQFALSEAAYTLVRLCHEFEHIVPSSEISNGDLKLCNNLALSVNGGVHVQFK